MTGVINKFQTERGIMPDVITTKQGTASYKLAMADVLLFQALQTDQPWYTQERAKAEIEGARRLILEAVAMIPE